jgi:hypothetical protein
MYSELYIIVKCRICNDLVKVESEIFRKYEVVIGLRYTDKYSVLEL